MNNQQPTTQPVIANIPKLDGWNWGAAGLTWIWGIRFRVWLAFLTFIPAIGGIWWIVLGLRGSEWAWQAQKWNSVEEFNQAMAPWKLWGKILFIISLVLPIALFILAIMLFSASSSSTSSY